MFIAKRYIRVGNKLYKPGEKLPDKLPDHVWKHLMQKKAIETIHDPVAAVLEDDTENTPHQPQMAAASPQVEPFEDVEETLEDDAAEEVMEKATPEPEEAPRKESKPARQSKQPREKTKDLPLINAADLVVSK